MVPLNRNNYELQQPIFTNPYSNPDSYDNDKNDKGQIKYCILFLVLHATLWSYHMMQYDLTVPSLNTHSGSLEIIPADMEVSPSLMVITGAPVFSTPTSSSSNISPTKTGVAYTHTQTHTGNHDSALLQTVKTSLFQVHCCFYQLY